MNQSLSESIMFSPPRRQSVSPTSLRRRQLLTQNVPSPEEIPYKGSSLEERYRHAYKTQPEKLGMFKQLPPEIFNAIFLGEGKSYTDIINLLSTCAQLNREFNSVCGALIHDQEFWQSLLKEKYGLEFDFLTDPIYVDPEFTYRILSEGLKIEFDGKVQTVPLEEAKGMMFIQLLLQKLGEDYRPLRILNVDKREENYYLDRLKSSVGRDMLRISKESLLNVVRGGYYIEEGNKNIIWFSKLNDAINTKIGIESSELFKEYRVVIIQSPRRDGYILVFVPKNYADYVVNYLRNHGYMIY